MKNVVIEIDGVRHRLYNKDVVACGCQACSLEEKCTGANGICFPFLTVKQYGHFIIEDKI
jgi:hypothetical protein